MINHILVIIDGHYVREKEAGNIAVKHTNAPTKKNNKINTRTKMKNPQREKHNVP